MPNNKINPSENEHSPAEGTPKEKKAWTVVKTAARVGRAIGFLPDKNQKAIAMRFGTTETGEPRVKASNIAIKKPSDYLGVGRSSADIYGEIAFMDAKSIYVYPMDQLEVKHKEGSLLLVKLPLKNVKEHLPTDIDVAERLTLTVSTHNGKVTGAKWDKKEDQEICFTDPANLDAREIQKLIISKAGFDKFDIQGLEDIQKKSGKKFTVNISTRKPGAPGTESLTTAIDISSDKLKLAVQDKIDHPPRRGVILDASEVAKNLVRDNAIKEWAKEHIDLVKELQIQARETLTSCLSKSVEGRQLEDPSVKRKSSTGGKRGGMR